MVPPYKQIIRVDEDEDVKMVTYAQLQKAGFMVDEDEDGSHDNSSMMVAKRDERLEFARRKMYKQIGNQA